MVRSRLNCLFRNIIIADTPASTAMLATNDISGMAPNHVEGDGNAMVLPAGQSGTRPETSALHAIHTPAREMITATPRERRMFVR